MPKKELVEYDPIPNSSKFVFPSSRHCFSRSLVTTDASKGLLCCRRIPDPHVVRESIVTILSLTASNWASRDIAFSIVPVSKQCNEGMGSKGTVDDKLII